ncbi:MAG: hypothetical protein ACFFDN_48995 [Candidatus Hodarchaeota archaeon]
MKNWIKLNLFYLGKSKKHHIFRAKKWNKNFEIIIYKSVFNENYEEVGNIKEIFGPINIPFISIKSLPDMQFGLENKFYIKIR